METNVDLIAFGTFGLPNGFRQTSLFSDSELSLKIKTLDLNTNAIKIFPKSKVYSVRKGLVGDIKTITYSIYSYAKEKNSDRGGTFLGASIIFFEKIATASLALDSLKEFHKQIISNNKNVDNNIIQVNHSDQLELPRGIRDFEKIKFNLKELGDINFSATHNDLVVYSLIKPELFEKSLELLTLYDTIYFTTSEDVASFVHERGLIKLIRNEAEFEETVKNFRLKKEEEKRQLLEQVISKTELEINELYNSKRFFLNAEGKKLEICNKIYHENSLQIERITKQHQNSILEINQSKNKLENIGFQFDEMVGKLKLALVDLREGKIQPTQMLSLTQNYAKDLSIVKAQFVIPSIKNLNEIENRSSSKPVSRYTHINSDDSKKRVLHLKKQLQLYGVFIAVLLIILVVTLFFLMMEKKLLNTF